MIQSVLSLSLNALYTKLCARELSDFDCCVMTGPTCIMHYAGLSSLSVPFTVAAESGLPRSIILFGADMQKFLAVGAGIERHGDAIPMPKLTGDLNC